MTNDHLRLAAHYLLLTTHYLRLVIFHLLPTTRYLQHVTYHTSYHSQVTIPCLLRQVWSEVTTHGFTPAWGSVWTQGKHTYHTSAPWRRDLIGCCCFAHSNPHWQPSSNTLKQQYPGNHAPRPHSQPKSQRQPRFLAAALITTLVVATY